MVWNRVLKNFAQIGFITALLCGGAQALLAQNSAASGGAWTDKATGLMWTTQDNGSNVNLNQAGEYCSGLRTGGYSDWRLPTIDELEGLYDSKQKKENKAKGPIELSQSCMVSSTTNDSGEVWNLCFNYGGRTLARASGHGSSGRAICVRAAGK